MRTSEMAFDRNLNTGPLTHVSPDKTTNLLAIPTSHPSGDAAEFPKYIYHQKNGTSMVVGSREEQDNAGSDYGDKPMPPATDVPFGADEKDIQDMSRSDLAAYGNLNYGLNLKGTQSRDDLQASIKQAAQAKADLAKVTAEAQKNGEENDASKQVAQS